MSIYITRTKIKPYKSESIAVFWHIISGSCEPILAGNSALQLGIIKFSTQPDTFQPILMIDSIRKGKLQEIIARYLENFTGLGKLKNHQVKLHIDENIKPVNVPPRSMPYHLKDRAQDAINEMIKLGVIEEHPQDEPALWVSNAVLAPKNDGSIRITLDARNVNKAILSTNHPIPKHEDIKAKLSGCTIFSKMDFKSEFWQIELQSESRHLTLFHANDRLYRYKRRLWESNPLKESSM